MDLRFIFCILLICTFEGSLSANRIRDSREFYLKNYQFSQLKNDLPAASISFANHSGLWVAGRESVWKWQFKGGDLFEINFRKTLAESNEKKIRSVLELNKNKLLVSTNSSLYLVRLNPNKIHKFDLKFSKKMNQRCFGVHLSGGKYFWILSDGVWQIDIEKIGLDFVNSHPLLEEQDKIIYDHEARSLWMVRGNKLLRHKYQKSDSPGMMDSKFVEILKVKYPFTNIHTSDYSIIAQTKYSLLVISKREEKLTKTIPVQSERRLVMADLGVNQHTYLFQDRFLELRNIKRKRSLYSKLKIGRVKKAEQIVVGSNLVGLILDGTPRVFQIEGQW